MNGCIQTITPRNGHTPVVGIVARTSIDVDAESRLQKQIDRSKAAVAVIHGGMVDYRVITVMTGDQDCPAQIEKLVRNGGLDLLVAADADRLVEASRPPT